MNRFLPFLRKQARHPRLQISGGHILKVSLLNGWLISASLFGQEFVDGLPVLDLTPLPPSVEGDAVLAPSATEVTGNTKEETVPTEPLDDGITGGVDAGPAGKFPKHTSELARKAASAFARGEWEAARAAYEEMVEFAPDNALAHANLGTLAHRTNNIETARYHLKRAVDLNPKLAQSWTLIGLIHLGKQEFQLALSALARAAHEDPKDPRIHNYLGVTIKALGWNNGAESELQKAIALDPEYAGAHFNLALMYLERKPPAKELARRHYEKSLDLGAPADEIMERQLAAE